MNKNFKTKIIKNSKMGERWVKVGEKIKGSYKSNIPNKKTKKVNGSILCVQKFKDERRDERRIRSK